MWTPKRFYKSAETGVSQDGYTILLDGRSVKTPAGAVLAVPTQALAQAIASEWDAQEDEIQPETMPAHQLAVSAIDGVRTNRRAIIAGILAFADTDLLCYRAVTPDDLVERQNSVWQPLLDWVQQNTSVPFVVTQGVMPVDQPPAVVTELRKTVEALDEFEIAVLSSVTAAAGSIVIALAMEKGRISGDEAFSASQLDETFQVELWGEDEEAAVRRTNLRAEILAAERFLGDLR